MNKIRIYLINKDKTYTAKELAETLNKHIRTIHKWHREGLPALPDLRPLLFKGEEVKRYLSVQCEKQKQPMKLNEFFCMHCHKPKGSIAAAVNIKPGQKIGKYQQYIVTGKCETCGARVSQLYGYNRKKYLY